MNPEFKKFMLGSGEMIQQWLRILDAPTDDPVWPKFISQHLHGGLQTSVTPGPEDLLPSSGFYKHSPMLCGHIDISRLQRMDLKS